jgi:serine phosphatase RsbU (regulator of sigma subunit)
MNPPDKYNLLPQFVMLLLLISIGTSPLQTVFAQKSNAEIMKLELKLKTVQGKEKCRILFKLTEQYIEHDTETAEDYAEEALKEAKKIKSKNYEADALNQLGTIFYRNNAYDEATDYYEEELKLRKELNDRFDLAVVSYNLASAYEYTGRDRKAIQTFEQSLKYAHKVNHQNLILMNNEALFQLYFSKNRYKKALDYFKEYVRIKDSTFVLKKTKQIAILKTEHQETKKQLSETDSTLHATDSTLHVVKQEKDTLQKISLQKSLEIENLKLEAQIRKQQLQNEKLQKKYFQMILGGVILAGILVLILALVLFKRYRYKKKINQHLERVNAELKQQKEEIKAQNDQIEYKNEELQQQNEEIVSQRDEIEAQRDLANEQRNEIVASINYALRIQKAVLPDKEFIKQVLPSHFILYKPRDIVSGDFYWVYKKGNKTVFAAADCTGHGVPGAFMSMLGMTLLNDIVNHKNITQANLILEELRKDLKHALKQTGKEKETKDGLDIALCVTDEDTNKLEYSGAYNPLLIIRDGELKKIKATRNPVGIYAYEKPFENHKLKIQKGDALYIFSDGYADQFGNKKPGDKIKKFKSGRFSKLLLKIHKESPEKQKAILDETIENWRQNAHEQVDDIIVMGIFI